MQTMIKRSLLLAAVMTVAATTVSGQTSATIPDAKMPAFDVVSVKVNNSGSMGCRANFPSDGSDRLSVTNCPLIMILRGAYGMFNSTDDVFTGLPGWAKSERFDIEAKMSEADIASLKVVDPMHPPQYAQDQRKLMLQALLTDRFKMTAHKETKMLPVYELVIAKSGSKLKEAVPGDTYANGIKGPDGVAHAGFMTYGRGKIMGQGIALGQLVSQLTQSTGRMVLDKTGLMGKYDVTLEWSPDDRSAADAASSGATDTLGVSIFTALQEQLGLKLAPAKGPVEMLVIDHVEMPSAN